MADPMQEFLSAHLKDLQLMFTVFTVAFKMHLIVVSISYLTGILIGTYHLQGTCLLQVIEM